MHGFRDVAVWGQQAIGLALQQSPILARLYELHERFRDDFHGTVATYIPELAKADPSQFGICLATVDGKLYEVGDSRQTFTIQSISKPFVYGLAMEDRGSETVLARVGVEPSGEAFNSIVFDERTNRPFNPMVNAGAIATTALIRGSDGEDRLGRLLAMFERFAGRRLVIDESVYRSEDETGHRNRAIAYLELNAGMVSEPVMEHLDLYFRQCSVLVDARDLAVMAATLANGGINPLTDATAMERTHVRSVLSVMESCGMYDFSGEWGFRVGLPAKSGVAGGIIAVLPGQFGIGVFSPPLDERGNSVRGIAVCEELSRYFNLHVYEPRRPAGTVVRRELDGSTVRSKRQRPEWQRAALDATAGGIVLWELQGDLFFASMERLCRGIFDRSRAMTSLILDGRRVGRIDGSARTLLRDLRDRLAGHGVSLLLAGFSSSAREFLVAEAGSDWPNESFFDANDAALEWCEDRLIEAHRPANSEGAAMVPFASLEIVAEFSETEVALVMTEVSEAHYAQGDVIVREGEPARNLYTIAVGAASVRVSLPGEGRYKRVGSIATGVTFGEFALFENARRIADVVADEPTICYVLPVARLHALAVIHPSVYAKFLGNVLRQTTDRLRRATDEIRALEA